MANYAAIGVADNIPSISTSTYTSNTTPVSGFINPSTGGFVNTTTTGVSDFWTKEYGRAQQFNQQLSQAHLAKPREKEMARRIVQVFIADTDENVPLEKSVIYTGEQKLTDATDQELFFEIDIKGILDRHNTYRKTLVNKKVKERTENLEPVKIRELKMVVVTIAEFK